MPEANISQALQIATLDLLGTATVLKIDITADAAGTTNLTPFDLLRGMGQAVPNVATVRGTTRNFCDTPSYDITFEAATGGFIRGDSNNDTRIDIADVIWTVEELFNGSNFPCEDAANANDQGGIDLADVVYLLDYLFPVGSPNPAPPAPFPDCGEDDSDPLGCTTSASCD